MPIPFIIVGATIAMGVSGVGMGAKGGYDQHRASKLNQDSNQRVENASHRLEDLRVKCSTSLQDLGDEKLTVLNGSVTKFVDVFSQLKNVDLENGAVECIAIRRRSYMFYNLLARLDSYLTPLTFAMEDLVKKEGTNYSLFSEQSKKTVASAAATVSSIKAVLDTPILTGSGALTEESENLLLGVDGKR